MRLLASQPGGGMALAQDVHSDDLRRLAQASSLAMAFSNTSCTFIIGSTSPAEYTWLGSTVPGSSALVKADTSRANETGHLTS
jgi:hypothetical protein